MIITKFAPKVMILPLSIMLVGPKIMKCSPVTGTTKLNDLITSTEYNEINTEYNDVNTKYNEVNTE